MVFCPKCQTSKEPSAFAKRLQTRKTAHCKLCAAVATKEWRLDNPDKAQTSEQRQAWAALNTPCGLGHTDRFANGSCKVCSKLSAPERRTHYEANKDALLATKQAYVATNKEHLEEKAKQWRQANPEKVRGYQLKHRSQPEVKEKLRAQRKLSDWAERLLAGAKAASKTRGHDPPAIDVAWIREQPLICPYLGVALEPSLESRGLLQPSLDRIDNDKGYAPDNVRLTSLAWNQMRNIAPLDRALALVEQIRIGSATKKEAA